MSVPSRTKQTDERDKDIGDVRRERDDLAMLLNRLIHALRQQPATPCRACGKFPDRQQVSDAALNVRDLATSYLTRKGLNGSPLR